MLKGQKVRLIILRDLSADFLLNKQHLSLLD